MKYNIASGYHSTHASKLFFQELLEASKIKEEAEDYALIYQVAEMLSLKVSKKYLYEWSNLTKLRQIAPFSGGP